MHMQLKHGPNFVLVTRPPLSEINVQILVPFRFGEHVVDAKDKLNAMEFQIDRTTIKALILVRTRLVPWIQIAS